MDDEFAKQIADRIYEDHGIEIVPDGEGGFLVKAGGASAWAPTFVEAMAVTMHALRFVVKMELRKQFKSHSSKTSYHRVLVA